MGKDKDFSDFDIGQMMMAWQLDKIISETAHLLSYLRYAVISMYYRLMQTRKILIKDRVLDGQGRAIYGRWERMLHRLDILPCLKLPMNLIVEMHWVCRNT